MDQDKVKLDLGKIKSSRRKFALAILDQFNAEADKWFGSPSSMVFDDSTWMKYLNPTQVQNITWALDVLCEWV